MSDQTKEVKEEVKEQPNAYLIPAELTHQLVNYLSDKPLKEVEGLVNGLRNSRPVTVQQEAPADQEESAKK